MSGDVGPSFRGLWRFAAAVVLILVAPEVLEWLGVDVPQYPR